MGGKLDRLTGITDTTGLSLAITALLITQPRERRRSKMLTAKWTVWVGGSEVNSEYLSQEKANYLAGYWIGRGYDDVVIEEVSK